MGQEVEERVGVERGVAGVGEGVGPAFSPRASVTVMLDTKTGFVWVIERDENDNTKSIKVIKEWHSLRVENSNGTAEIVFIETKSGKVIIENTENQYLRFIIGVFP